MKQIKVKPNQTLFDISIEQYGTCEAIEELILLNPNITNKRRKEDVVIGKKAYFDFYIDCAVAEGTMVTINPNSELRHLSVIKELQGMNITTYNNGKDENPDTE